MTLAVSSIATAETHVVQVGNTFDPAFLEVAPGDIDGSGLVDGADLSMLLGEWGDC